MSLCRQSQESFHLILIRQLDGVVSITIIMPIILHRSSIRKHDDLFIETGKQR